VSAQLPLELRLQRGHTFANFQVGGGNSHLAQERLRQLAVGAAPDPVTPLFLWGLAGSGKTHLLQACCRQASDSGHSIAYLPLDQLQTLGPGVLENLEQRQLICIDQLEVVAGQAPWEGALFTLFNRIQEAGSNLVVAGRKPPSTLTRTDLSSRLASGVTIELPAPNETALRQILHHRAATLGLQPGEEAVTYLLQRTRRDLHSLMALLERLDRASLVTQRRLTVPLIRQVLIAEETDSVS